MSTQHSVGSGFLLIVILMALVSFTGQRYVHNTRDANFTIASIHDQQTQAAHSLLQLLRYNNLAIYQIQTNSNALALENYQRLSVPLQQIKHTIDELAKHPQGASLTPASQLLTKVVQLHANHTQDLQTEMETGQQLAENLESLIKHLDRTTQERLLSAKNEHQQIARFIGLFDIATIALAIIVAALVMRRTSRMETDLRREKHQAQTTLKALGEAVISVDNEKRITFLNPVAESLCGWTNDEAQGQPFSGVICVSDERTDRPLDLLTSEYNTTVDLPGELQLKNRHHEIYAVEGSISPLRCEQNICSGHVIVFRDVTHSRMISSQLHWHAQHDVLTSLLNRREFERRLGQAIELARLRNEQHALLYIDLDQFKIVNDTCGHDAGDKLLQDLSELLQHDIRYNDTLARLGGDEFGLLLENCEAEQALSIANQLLLRVQNFRFSWQDNIFKVGASIGIVLIDQFSEGAIDALRQADAACYVAKDQGRNRAWIHSLDDNEINQHHGDMLQTSNITRALEEDRFLIHRQLIRPTRNTVGGQHFELLLRMIDTNGQLISPLAFIPAAERFGLMTNIDRWVIRHALHTLASGQHDDLNAELWTINISAQSFTDDSFLGYVLNEFQHSGINPHKICFEITETAAIANWLNATQFIRELKSLGCRFALDDFGSGMSSFSYLKRLNIDYLKIDGSFVRNITQSKVDLAMVEAFHQIGHVLGIQTIAEFVENDDILYALEEIGIDFVQGHGIAEPVEM
ncbi:MAG: EAL domain-containing protein [Gammaproteobacteria bacterium]|nr:EAL domain-containing protein [Gammaproteobacteria bacterium]